jgi:hypothetical protein
MNSSFRNMDPSKINDHLSSEDDTSSYVRITVITILASIIGAFIVAVTGFAEIKSNWPKYRCKPQYIAAAPLFGHNLAENFDFCVKNVMDKEASGALSPIYKTLATFIGIISTLLQSTNSLRLQLATLVGGIVKIVQQFTDRFSQFQFALRSSAIRMKSIMYRTYGTMMSMIYMGLSGVVAVQNLGDNSLVRFLSTFCFPPSTPIYVHGRGIIPISNVSIGDRLAHGGHVTARFLFSAKGQPMVRLGHVRVSTNHFVQAPDGGWIMAGDHPDAKKDRDWEHGDEWPLVCLNTSDHKIPLGRYMFSDYDETEKGDMEAAQFVEKSINGSAPSTVHDFKEYGSLMHPMTIVSKEGLLASHVDLGHMFENGAKVIGIIDKLTTDVVQLDQQTVVTSSTLVWSAIENKFIRAIDIPGAKRITLSQPELYRGFIVSSHSYITTTSGFNLRDYIEVLSPDTENSYAEILRLAHKQQVIAAK